MKDQGKAPQSQTDRLMADLRAKIPAIAAAADRSGEQCVAFYRKEAEYNAWIERHRTNGFILDRDAATSKTARLHFATCPLISGGEDSIHTSKPKVACPTKEAAVVFARTKKWKLVEGCEKCAEQVASA